MAMCEVIGFLPQSGHFRGRGFRSAMGGSAFKTFKRLLQAGQRRTRLGHWLIFYIFQLSAATTSNPVLSIER
jgi:hypothetical protein